MMNGRTNLKQYDFDIKTSTFTIYITFWMFSQIHQNIRGIYGQLIAEGSASKKEL